MAVNPQQWLNAARILELANKAYFLYVKQPPSKKAKLPKTVLSNRAIDGVSIYSIHRKPFELIFRRLKTERMVRPRDLNSRSFGS